jgi:hypothetical protein
MNKKRNYLKDKLNERATHSNNKDIRNTYKGINKFKKGWATGGFSKSAQLHGVKKVKLSLCLTN